MNQKLVNRTLSLLILMALPACAAKLAEEKLSAPEEVRISKMDVNRYPVTKLVCDPMGDQPDPRSNAGLKAELFWLTSKQAAAKNTQDLIARGTKSTQSLFFTQLNVPTRLFNTGFVTDSGQPLKNDGGETLIENFALRFSSVLRLSPEQDEGLYEFAVLSDDGTVMRIRDDNGVYQPIVSSDGDHPTALGCSSTPVSFTHQTEKLMQLDYYQGPRYHIALMVLMRKVSGKDPACGVSGNATWFDPNHGSAPQKAFKDLLARGWRVLTADNYAIPVQVGFNPCKDGVIPALSNVSFGESFSDAVSLDWETDIASTSQIVVTDPSTNAQLISTADNTLTLHHHVMLGGLKANTLYHVEAVSISDTYGKGMSDLLSFRTQP